jgi:hypothetical protein
MSLLVSGKVGKIDIFFHAKGPIGDVAEGHIGAIKHWGSGDFEIGHGRSALVGLVGFVGLELTGLVGLVELARLAGWAGLTGLIGLTGLVGQ